MTRRQRAARAAPYLIVGAGAGYLYHVASSIQYQARAGTLGPDFWPKLILTLIIATCIYEIVKTFVATRASEVEGVLSTFADETALEKRAAPPGARQPWLLVAGIGLTSAYVALVGTLGFFLATVPYIAAFIVLGGYRRWGVVTIVSVVGTLAMVFLFMKVVYVSLPLGRAPFQQVSLVLMQLFGIR